MSEAERRARRVPLGALAVDAISERECIAHVLAALEAGQGGWILTANLHHLALSRRDPRFAEICSSASLVVADGMPLVWASRLQGTPVPERIAGSDLIVSLTRSVGDRGHSVFLLGGAPGAAEQAAAELSGRVPQLPNVHTWCPPLGFRPEVDAWVPTIDRLREAAPSVIYVALSTPRQEEVCRALRFALPAVWIVTVGISLSFLAGYVRRAPRWMQRSGLEWMHRLVQEPRRLGKRYLVDDSPEAARLLLSAASLRRPSSRP